MTAVILEGHIHCSGEDCEVHQHVGADTMALGLLPPGWVVVQHYENNGVVIEDAFCEANCALKALAKVPPSERIEMGPETSDG